MTLKKGFEPHLAFDGTTVSGRDIQMLRAIDEYGSMYKAADELGRSYPHLQRRVVELEETLGQLTERMRGGADGGGTKLTAEAVDLIRRFERLRVELSGVANVPESIISGTVTARDGELATVETAAGDITARVPTAATHVEIAVRADAVVLMEPGSPSHGHTSLRNQIPGVVRDLQIGNSVVAVSVDIAEGVRVTSMITEESANRLGLEEGVDVIAAFKSTAARAIETDP